MKFLMIIVGIYWSLFLLSHIIPIPYFTDSILHKEDFM